MSKNQKKDLKPKEEKKEGKPKIYHQKKKNKEEEFINLTNQQNSDIVQNKEENLETTPKKIKTKQKSKNETTNKEYVDSVQINSEEIFKNQQKLDTENEIENKQNLEEKNLQKQTESENLKEEYYQKEDLENDSIFQEEYKNTKSNIFSIFLLIVSTILILIIGIIGQRVYFLEKNISSINQNISNIKDIIIPFEKPTIAENWKGDENNRYVWIVYSDYQCTFCKGFHPNFNTLNQKYTNISFVFRHFPISSIHVDAKDFAMGAECVSEVNREKFWEYTDIVFQQMPKIKKDDIKNIVDSIGLDGQKAIDCVNSQKYSEKVENSFNKGIDAGINSTPTSVLYDLKTDRFEVIRGALPIEELEKKLEDFTGQE